MVKFRNKSPSYLLWTPYGYYFRLRVPADLRQYLGIKTELRYALKTGNQSAAKEKARLLAGRIQRLFKQLRRRGSYMELSEEQVQRIIKGYVRDLLEDDEVERVMSEFPIHDETHNQQMREYEASIEFYKRDLALSNYDRIDRMAERILNERSIGFDKDSYPYKKLCRELLKANIQLIERLKLREKGEYSDEVSSAAEAPKKFTEEPPSIPLSQLIDDYFSENLRASKWSPRTIKEYKNSFRMLKEFIGRDTPVNSVGHKEMQKYKKLLIKLPANFFKTKKYEGMSLHDILKMDIEGGLSVSAINRYLMNASAVFRYAARNGHMKINPAEGLQLPKQKRPQEERDIFNDDDLRKIFHSKKYKEDSFRQPFMFWLPILGLYTGCRIEELCQLHCDDLEKIDGIWCININDDGDKRLKNTPSKRIIPLHPVLAETLNFPEFVKRIKGRGETRIFPELKKISFAWSHSASKWFNSRYKKQIGLNTEKGKKKTYHSFRHTLSDHLKQKLISGTLIDELTGHAVQGESLGRYGKPYVAEILYNEAVLKLDFKIDLDHLINSKFVCKPK
jgi:integrase